MIYINSYQSEKMIHCCLVDLHIPYPREAYPSVYVFARTWDTVYWCLNNPRGIRRCTPHTVNDKLLVIKLDIKQGRNR